VAEGHTILSRASGPVLLLLEEPVGSLLKKKEVEHGSTPRSPEQAVYDGLRDDAALAPSQSKAKAHGRLRHVAAALPGPPSPAAGEK
jgi:hypothetical protein